MSAAADILSELLSERSSARLSVVQELAPELAFDDIWAPEPDVNLIVPAFGIAPGPPHLVTGSWYTGKTLFLVTMGLCVGSGHDLFGVYRVNRGKWIHFDHEMGRRHIKRYLKRLRAGLNIDVEDLRDRMSIRVLPKLNLCSPEAEEYYTEILRGYSLCTIDPLRAAAPGQDENKSEFRQWLDMLGRVSDRTGCAIVVLHHGGKPTEGAERRNTGRGTSAIDDAVQSKFVLTAQEKGGPIQVSHEKTRELNAPLEDFYLVVRSDADGVHFEHQEPEQMREAMAHASEAKEADRVSRAKDAVRAVFTKFAGRVPGPRESVLGLVSGNRATLSRAFSEMLAEQEIVREGSRGDVVFVAVSK